MMFRMLDSGAFFIRSDWQMARVEPMDMRCLAWLAKCAWESSPSKPEGFWPMPSAGRVRGAGPGKGKPSKPPFPGEQAINPRQA